MNALYSPLTLAFAAALVAALAARAGRRPLLTIALAALLLFAGLTTPLGANLLVGAIEAAPASARRPLAAACPDARALVFLSGGVQRPPVSANDFGALTSETLDRVFAFEAAGGPGRLPLIISGGGPFAVAEAAVIASLLERLGVPAAAMTLETRSTSTRSSALQVARLLGADQRPVVVATSALHLPRASLAFRQAGFEVCPWPLNRRYIRVRSLAGLWPRSSALVKSEWALHELIGQLHYRLNRRRPDDNGTAP